MKVTTGDELITGFHCSIQIQQTVKILLLCMFQMRGKMVDWLIVCITQSGPNPKKKQSNHNHIFNCGRTLFSNSNRDSGEDERNKKTKQK